MSHYRIVPDRSHVIMNARSSLHPIHTRVDGLDGYVEMEVLDGGRVNLSASPKAKLSFPVDRLTSSNLLKDRELKRRIDARRYPTINGQLGELRESEKDGHYVARGDVSFRGVTKTYEDEMAITAIDDRTLKLEGEHTFDIRDFDMEPPKILMLRVEPDVHVRVEIVAEKGKD
ncbi:MAG TPA: YceI family protein [Acidimicrobiia bacterium]